ncbi:hypothetical protein [Streptomyces melanosporofaciens]|uniref:Sugar kinase n=1 Tax=Streptomyces melanosporofaciens TaxID=67327 RepID=A0A1H4VCI4_STRMJ|nr:hypothetical protein [Streptomyces melanosporofaciens]SEC78666.1 hypothetical protein SAMN04490356_5521 [Streptomyces melanosporofaciens]
MTAAEQRPGAPMPPAADGRHPDGPTSGGPTSGGSTSGGGRPSRRWLKAVIVFLLIAIPAGYLVISAIQSRNGGEEKAEAASAKGLSAGYPTRVQRRIYDVPVPPHSKKVAFYETNSWKVSSLYVQFVTDRDGLDSFLHRIGTARSALDKGKVTITGDQAKKVGWQVGEAGHDWAGMELKQKDPQPKLRITVKFDNPAHPKVYVVSTVTP